MDDDYKSSSTYRLKEAQWLYHLGVEEGHYEGCFYVGGYVTETSLKYLSETLGEPRTGHHISVLSNFVRRLLEGNDLITSSSSEMLFLSLEDELISKWKVDYRYQGEIDFLTEETAKSFISNTEYIYLCVRQIADEWKLLEEVSIHGD